MLIWRATMVAVAGLVSAATLICLIDSTEWVDRPFMGFLMGRNRIVAPIGLSHWTGFRASVPFGAQLIEVDGRPVQRVAPLIEATWETPVGTPRRYAFETAAGRTERTVPVMRFTLGDYVSLFGVWIVNGALFIGLGFLVAYLKPCRAASAAMLAFGVAWGLTLYLSLGDFYRFHFRSLYAIVQAVSPAALVFLALTFPDRPLPRRWPVLLGGFGVLTVLHAGADIWLYERNPQLWIRFFDVSLLYAAVCALASCVLLGRYYRKAPYDARIRLQMIALGAVVAFGVPSVIHLAARLMGVQLPVNLLPSVMGLFPLAVAYAILKHDVLALDPLLTRSVFYAGFTAAVTIGYVALLGLASAAQPGEAPGASAWVPFLFTIAVVAVVAPLRRAAQAFVDRLFFRTRYDLQATIEAASRSLTGSLDQREIEARIRSTLADTVAPDPCWVLRPDGHGHLRELTTDGTDVAIPVDHPSIGRATGPGAAVVALDDDSAPGGLRDAGVTLLVPLRIDAGIEGVLAVGRKQSGAAYSARDLALLRTLGNQAAIALRNAASYETLRELSTSLEERVAERTTDLARTHDQLLRTQAQLARADKLASLGRLVAGVAHEVNNPVSFISSSVDLIHDAAVRVRDDLDGTVEPGVLRSLEQLLENTAICREGATRAGRIVRELTAFSRASQDRWEPIDLHAALDRTFHLLRGETRDRVTVVREYGNVPHPHGNAGDMDQVLMNLLANAVQAIDGDGEIRARTHAVNGSVFVELRDTGPGIPAELQERIFEPFFTTKNGQGTGLGLAIAQAIVARHGGDLTVESASAAGTTFVIRLPVGTAENGANSA